MKYKYTHIYSYVRCVYAVGFPCNSCLFVNTLSSLMARCVVCVDVSFVCVNRTQETRWEACWKVSSTFARKTRSVAYPLRRRVSICSSCPTISVRVFYGRSFAMLSMLMRALNCLEIVSYLSCVEEWCELLYFVFLLHALHRLQYMRCYDVLALSWTWCFARRDFTSQVILYM